MKFSVCLLLLVALLVRQQATEAKSTGASDSATIAQIKTVESNIDSTATRIANQIANAAGEIVSTGAASDASGSGEADTSSTATKVASTPVCSCTVTKDSSSTTGTKDSSTNTATKNSSTSTATDSGSAKSTNAKIANSIAVDGATIIAEAGNEGAKILGGAAALSAPYIKQVDQGLGEGANALGNLLGNL